MHFASFRSGFLRVLKFLQVKEGGPNFGRDPILQKIWVIWCPLLYFNFKSFLATHSLLFLRFQCIPHDSGVLFTESWNFYTKDGGPNFWWEPVLQKVWIIWSPLLYFNFKNLMDKISSSFIRFQCILHDWGLLFSESWNF